MSRPFLVVGLFLSGVFAGLALLGGRHLALAFWTLMGIACFLQFRRTAQR